MTNYLALTIAEIRQETRDTKSFVLKETGSEKIAYLPGQSLTLVFPGKINEERRSYSISSASALNEPLTITVKRIDNGNYSRHLFDQCHVGSPIYTIGAGGFFTLPDFRENKPEGIVFFAAGSGITPVIALIKTILYGHDLQNVLLIYSNHSMSSTIFYQQLVDLQEKFPDRFKIDFLFSDAKNLMRARLSKVMVSEYVRRSFINDPERTLFYICGPHPYMQMVTIALLTEGVPAGNIRKEIFDTLKPLRKELPPDQLPHQVSLSYKNEKFSFEAKFPETILQAAKNKGIVLPYSCEAGKCGTCAASCVSGKVWMYYNEVLMDKELLSGRVLTCTGYAVGGDVVLEYPESR